MKWTTYKKYEGEGWDSLDLEDLVNELADFLLQSGFGSEYYQISEMDSDRTMEQLRQAIMDALMSGDLFSEEEAEAISEKLRNMSSEQRDRIADKLIERLEEEGYISVTEPPDPSQQQANKGQGTLGPEGRAKFEVTDKSLDFLGFKTLKDLMASLGKSSAGRHD